MGGRGKGKSKKLEEGTHTCLSQPHQAQHGSSTFEGHLTHRALNSIAHRILNI